VSSRLVVLLLLRGGLSRRRWPPVDGVACGLVAGTWHNIACRLTCCCGNCIYFLLMTRSSCSVSVLALYAPLIRFTSLRGYVGRDHEDLSVQDLKYLARIVGGDGRTGNLGREAVRGRFTVELSAMSRGERSVKLLEASHVFGVS
jgi:hypothetical protein